MEERERTMLWLAQAKGKAKGVRGIRRSAGRTFSAFETAQKAEVCSTRIFTNVTDRDLEIDKETRKRFRLPTH